MYEVLFLFFCNNNDERSVYRFCFGFSYVFDLFGFSSHANASALSYHAITAFRASRIQAPHILSPFGQMTLCGRRISIQGATTRMTQACYDKI
jgi:hypothetical protein